MLKLLDYIGFLLKTVVLFCFIYEFVLSAFPSSLLSSRKIAFVIMAVYFALKRYSLRPLFSNKKYRNLLYLCIFCFLYVLVLCVINDGNGTTALSWYVYFPLYAIVGSFLCAGFFDWKYERVIKAIAIVTIFQAIWCMLTFYMDEFRVLNDLLFVVDENENIDFLRMTRLRSIGSAGSALSVCISLSSFSFLYFVIKGKNLLLNIFLYFFCNFATFLAGATGVIISIIGLLVTLALSYKVGKRGVLIIALIPIFLFALYHSMGAILEDDQYRRLTEKLVDFYEGGMESGTFETLENQRVSGVSLATIMGTGYSRGQVGSDYCFHDSGYIRNYFALGFIMAVVFYFFLYKTMWGLIKEIRGSSYFGLLAIMVLIIMVIEYKEPYIFYYFPVFIFNSLFFAAKASIGGDIIVCYRNLVVKKR